MGKPAKNPGATGDPSVVICMLRGVNVGGHNQIKMEALRALCESLGLLDVQTYVQSGNAVFRTQERSLAALAKSIEDGIQRGFGFRPSAVLRTTSEMRAAIAKNPFAARQGIEPNKLLVTFLAAAPDAESHGNALAIKTFPEELRIDGREVYIYFPNGMARPKMSWPRIEKALKTSGTGRNWNTVTKLLEMAEALESI
jgi:uncharacterized protein (DUF1697 family)